jgi:hypothetical protein
MMKGIMNETTRHGYHYNRDEKEEERVGQLVGEVSY